MNRMKLRLALAVLALSLALPARAANEWYKLLGANTWTMYNYLNYSRDAAGENDWYWNNFSGAPMKYFLKYVNNSTSEGHCYEIEIGPPENYPGEWGSFIAHFWDNAAGNWTDLLGYHGSGKARLYLKRSEFQMFLTFHAADPDHGGYYLHRKSLTESQCTTGQSTYNWLKIIDGVQTKNLLVRK